MNENDYRAYFNGPDFQKTLTRYEAMTFNQRNEYFEAEELTDIAEYYAENGRMEEAERAIKLALALHPGSTDPLVFKSRTCMLEGNDEKAWNIANTIPNQEDREVLFLKAELHLNAMRTEPAQKILAPLAGVSDDPEDTYYNNYDIATLLMDYGNFYEAIPYLVYAERAAQELHDKPELIEALSQRATCHRECEEYEQAIDVINNILDIDPYQAQQWIALGTIYNFLNRHDDALEAYEFAEAIDNKNPECYFHKANTYSCLGDNEKALKLYTQCIESGYALDVSHYTCGLIYYNKMEFDQAIRHLEEALKYADGISSISFGIYFNLGLAHSMKGENNKAKFYLDKAFELDPSDDELNSLLHQLSQKPE